MYATASHYDYKCIHLSCAGSEKILVIDNVETVCLVQAYEETEDDKSLFSTSRKNV